MVWPLVIAAGVSTAMSVYGSSQQARAAKDSAKARAMSNAQTAKQLKTEAQGRRLLNLEARYAADSAIIAGAGARNVQIDSASNLAQMRGNRAKMELDNLSINAGMQQRVANLWADSTAAYKTAQLQSQMAGINAVKSIANFGATAMGAMGGPATTSAVNPSSAGMTTSSTGLTQFRTNEAMALGLEL